MPGTETGKRGRPPLPEEYEGVSKYLLVLPRPLMEAIDLKAQYDRCSKAEVMRPILWYGIRLAAATDRRFMELLTKNGIDVAPVNLKPRKEIYKDDPSDLV